MSEKQISNSKNVIVDSNVSVGGNLHIGDVINIQQVLADTPTRSQKKKDKAIVQEIQELIEQNKIKNALVKALSYTKEIDADSHRRFILLANRWNRLMDEKMANTLYREDYNVELNQIVGALTSLVEDL